MKHQPTNHLMQLGGQQTTVVQSAQLVVFARDKTKSLKYKIFIFENVFIREKQKEKKRKKQIKTIQIVWLLAYHTSART